MNFVQAALLLQSLDEQERVALKILLTGLYKTFRHEHAHAHDDVDTPWHVAGAALSMINYVLIRINEISARYSAMQSQCTAD